MLGKITFWWLWLQTRLGQFADEGERGDENITKAFYAALGITVATLIGAGITAFVNGKLPLIGGH
ncbi:hypothetical protein DMA12_41805 [Amycolatopsis balhimycina DSM 5908]|uniref:Uncharacterized protein n=1 Tax=Amycolatopsis balhimycina DSM 5908 TaxID=1081091 RepID=A0A428VYY0_AMYBA|nr:hypothetical protein [Amycolatopsis balhimycina]RSM36018.1 hypothetical protein DMA12_41805 [Amycolatopsis balhimycina DSM 5908]